MATIEERVADLEGKMIPDLRDELRRGFAQMSARFDAVDKRFDAANQRFDGWTNGSIASKAASSESTTGPIVTSCGSSAFSSR